MNYLPIRRPGDDADGSACIIPANVGYCDGCGCYRRVDWGDGESLPIGWKVIRINGYPYTFCPKHGDDALPKLDCNGG